MRYSQLISVDNLFQAWDEFKKGKRKKYDVQVFERNLEDNLFSLHEKLSNKTYKHGTYTDFYVNDPKRRHIHKAEVADRIVHHLLYKYLYTLFDKTFIYNSYSCRIGKGTHKAVKRLEMFARKLSKNYTCDFWALKLDIKQFFASVDHQILLNLIKRRVDDKKILWLINQIVDSFAPGTGLNPNGVVPQKGIPLGNLTSQIFANIYLSKLDQFIKHKLKIKYYLRYADDFLMLGLNKEGLLQRFKTVKHYLWKSLKLEIHPNKISMRKFSWGIDFCGYIVLPHYILPRAKTKRRILKKIVKENISNQSLQSYLGYFSHSSALEITQNIRNSFYLKCQVHQFDELDSKNYGGVIDSNSRVCYYYTV